MNNLVVFRDQLLPPSNTFVMQQASFLKNFRPIFCGSKYEGKFNSGPYDHYIIDRGNRWLNKIEEARFKIFGKVPHYANELRAKDVKMIHAHFGPDGLLALPIAKHLNIPLMVTFHGYEVTVKEELLAGISYRDKAFIKAKHKLNEDGAMFIAVSKYLEKEMISRGFDSNKIVQHYIGIDTDYFTGDPSAKKEKVILFVGRLVEKKGLQYLIDAMETVQKKDDEVKLVIIGDGVLREELTQRATSKRINCEFLGVKNSQEIRNWINRAMIFCVPSIIASNGDAESFGIVFAEAQSMGVPVVSFSSGGIPEVVSHNETGLLAEQKDTAALAEHLLELLGDEEKRKKFSANGKELIREKFDIRKQSIKLEEYYSRLIG